MKISEQARTQILRLIDEGDSLDVFDLEAFQRWMMATYEALQSDRVQQQRFDEYCRLSVTHTPLMRVRCGVRMLKQILSKAAPENYPPL